MTALQSVENYCDKYCESNDPLLKETLLAATKKDTALEAATAEKRGETTIIGVNPPNFIHLRFDLKQDAPIVMARFAAKAEIMRTQQEGRSASNKKKREPKDFEKQYRESLYRLTDGTYGIPASAFRNALIRACSLVNYKMVMAKMTIFVIADGYDREGTPLVRVHGKPQMRTDYVRNANGVVDIRARAMFVQWKCSLVLRFDGDQFTERDVTNLLHRTGLQVGILEGRPSSKNSAGMGWGTFVIDSVSNKARPTRKKRAS